MRWCEDEEADVEEVEEEEEEEVNGPAKLPPNSVRILSSGRGGRL